MAEVPDALVEKAAEAMRRGGGCTPEEIAREALAAVLPDVRRAVTEEIAGRCSDEVGHYARLAVRYSDSTDSVNAQLRFLFTCKQEAYEDAARIAREVST